MYAGKIVEVGTAEEIFYNPQHPYTWGLLGSMPTLESESDRLYAIPVLLQIYWTRQRAMPFTRVMSSR